MTGATEKPSIETTINGDLAHVTRCSWIEAGILGINHINVFRPETPVDGIKENGNGRKSETDGLDMHLTPKLVSQVTV